MTVTIGRRELLVALGGVARAQQSALPVVGIVNAGSHAASAYRGAAFRKGLREIGHVEGQNVTVEYHWLEGQGRRLRRRVWRPCGGARERSCVDERRRGPRDDRW